jgi:hypothetical protein
MRLLECTGRFVVTGGPSYQPGEVVALPDDIAEQYLRQHAQCWRIDSFEEAKREAACVAAVDHPAVDKMLKKPDQKKGRA